MIQQYLPQFWNHSSFIVSSFRFCIEVSSVLLFLLTPRQDRKQRIDTDDPSPRVVLLFKTIAAIITSYCQCVVASLSPNRNPVDPLNSGES